MKNYLELRKEELKKRGNKGFTLMEMLIVVAIIAVLIAIAIPVFTTQLENSREAADLANVRSAYAEQMAAYLNWDGKTPIADKNVPVTQAQAKWQSQKDAENATIAAGEAGKGVSVPSKTAGEGVNYVVKINTTTGEVTVE